MEYKLTPDKSDKTKLKIEFTFTKKEWDTAGEEAYKKEAGKYKMQGFRAGKAPKGMIEKAYGADIFVEGTVSSLFVPAYREVLAQNKDINPIDYPSVDFNHNEDGSVSIDAEIEVVPSFKLGNYKGLSVKKTKAEVKDEQVEEFIQSLAERHASLDDAKAGHKIATGDTAVISFLGTIDGVAFPGGASPNHELEIGSKSFIDTFEDQLVGLVIGDKKDVKVMFPTNYHAEEFAGKNAVFAVEVLGIKVKIKPELNDKFVAEISPFKTVSELKEDVKKNMQAQAEQEARQTDEQNLAREIIKGTKLEIPAKMIEKQVDQQLQDLDYRLSMQGANIEMYAQFMGKTMDELRAEEHDKALFIIQNRLVFDEIQKQEKIEVTAEEVDARIIEIANGDKKREKEIRGNRDRVRFVEGDLGYTKILEFLFANNSVK